MSKRVLTRKAAIEALGAVGAGAGPAVPTLFDMALHDKGGGFVWSIKDKACCAIAKIVAAGVPLLLDALKSPESQTQVATEVLYLMTSESAGHAKTAKESLERCCRTWIRSLEFSQHSDTGICRKKRTGCDRFSCPYSKDIWKTVIVPREKALREVGNHAMLLSLSTAFRSWEQKRLLRSSCCSIFYRMRTT